MSRSMRVLAFLVMLAPVPAAYAANPPALVNYQGVLRDASDNPLSGSYDMAFRFFDAPTGGNEMLVDAHTAAGGSAVVVTGGLFNVQLGGGTVSDGSGPGNYTTLADVFAWYEVWLSIQVGLETLDPRVRIVSAAYAQNASRFGGQSMASYLRTDEVPQTKAGQLFLEDGLESRGDPAGNFVQPFGGGDVRIAEGVLGIRSHGYSMGGYFFSDGGAKAELAVGSTVGVRGYGNETGGVFLTLAESGAAYCANHHQGIYAYGNEAGGYFRDADNTGYAYCGYGEYGIQAFGGTAGGYFKDANDSGSAYCGVGGTGVQGLGNSMGGLFQDLDQSGYAYLGYGDQGIQAFGGTAGGYFKDADESGYAYCGAGAMGVESGGNAVGGLFRDLDNSGYAYVGYGDRGLWGKGNLAGGSFSHPDNVTFWADVSTSTYKVHGTGAVSFVQNHPYRRDQVIVYAAPEGDEVAVYTRGTAQLENGVARVALGPTFTLVANPDVGLTAHLTPRGEVERLWVESIDTGELVVRGPAGGNVLFDYLVYGLRIGFEDLAVVQPKEREALLPDPAAIAASYGGREELRAYGAEARFRSMPGARVEDGRRSAALRRAIDGDRAAAIAAAAGADRVEPIADQPARSRAEPAVNTGLERGGAPAGAAAPPAVVESPQEPAVAAVLLPVSDVVEAGDVLVSDPLLTGALRRGTIASDPRVVGVAVGPATDGEAPVATYGVVLCKVDAAFGPVVPGDLLVAAPTLGHAMRAVGQEAGTILGKALEALDAGAATIRVLVMPR